MIRGLVAQEGRVKEQAQAKVAEHVSEEADDATVGATQG